MIKIQKVFEGDPTGGILTDTRRYPADGYVFYIGELSYPKGDGKSITIQGVRTYIRLSDLASFALSDADITEVDSWRDDNG